jgi:hypothetical protein
MKLIRKLYHTYGFYLLYRRKLVSKQQFSEFKRIVWEGE